MDKEKYILPPLTSYLLKNIVFSMENQESLGFLDLISGEVVEVSDIKESVVVRESQSSKKLISVSISKNKDRFLALPTWGSIEGFKIREQFIKNVKNPVYKKKLDHVFHTGRGVFKKFKQVLKENPIIERQWREFKADYMKAIVVNWYKECEGYINLIGLDEEIEELPNDLLISDFVFSVEVNYKDIVVINKLKNDFINELNDEERLLIKRRQTILKKPRYIVAYNLENEIVGYIEWEDIGNSYAEVTSYGVVRQYRGLGIYSILFDKLMRQTCREKFVKLLHINVENLSILCRNVKKNEISCNLLYSTIDIISWNEKRDSSELMDV